MISSWNLDVQGKKDVTNSYNSEEKKGTGLKLTNFIIEVTNDVWCNSLLITQEMIVSWPFIEWMTTSFTFHWWWNSEYLIINCDGKCFNKLRVDWMVTIRKTL